jgi:hypothetical protein
MNSETILTVDGWTLREEQIYFNKRGLIANNGRDREFICFWPRDISMPLEFIRPTKAFAEAVTAWMRLIT